MEKCLFLYNPEAGRGKIKKREGYILSRLQEKYEVTCVRSQYAGNISDTILEVGENFSLIVGGGGDGTLNEIINAVMKLDNKPKIGYIPAGTVNDVAHSLYIPRKIKGAVDNILEGKTFRHDVMKINDRFGIYICCAGLFTESSYSTGQNVKKKIGKIAYAFHGVKKIFSTPALDLTLRFDKGILKGRYAIFLAVNSRYTAGMKIMKKAILNDGKVDVILIESKSERVGLLSLLKTIFLFLLGIGAFIGRKGVTHLSLSSFSIETNSDTIINVDGERASKGNISFEVIKEGVEIIVPKPNKLKR